MQVSGVVVSVEMNVEIPKNGGGVYPGSRLTYRSQDGKISEQAFHQNVFKFNKSLEGVLKSLKPGDNIVIEKEKNEGGYWEVKGISVGGNDSTSVTTPAVKSGGNWETPEERAKKQLYIVRQSSLGHAVALSAANGGKKTTPEEIIEIAEKFVKYVMNGDDSIFSMTDDIPE